MVSLTIFIAICCCFKSQWIKKTTHTRWSENVKSLKFHRTCESEMKIFLSLDYWSREYELVSEWTLKKSDSGKIDKKLNQKKIPRDLKKLVDQKITLIFSFTADCDLHRKLVKLNKNKFNCFYFTLISFTNLNKDKRGGGEKTTHDPRRKCIFKKWISLNYILQLFSSD